MIKFYIEYDSEGNPIYVHIDTGFSKMCGPYNEEEHGWMLTSETTL